MQRLSGRLRDVVSYENRITRGLFQEEVWTHRLFGKEFIARAHALTGVVGGVGDRKAAGFTRLDRNSHIL